MTWERGKLCARSDREGHNPFYMFFIALFVQVKKVPLSLGPSNRIIKNE